MYALISENMTHLGGPMGSEYTTINYTKYFKSINNAKKYAEKEYGNIIKWKFSYAYSIDYKDKVINGMTSGDLAYVMYTIKPIKVEDND